MDGRLKLRRMLGKTGFKATRIGIGDLADRSLSIAECVRTARMAMDAGLNVIDTAPMYEDGYSETIVGKALKGRRDSMFVIDKVDHHDKPVMAQVDGSLKRLKLDATDLFVLHALDGIANWKRLASHGGAMDQLADCIRAGKTRFRGISSHDPVVLKSAILSGLCDVVMFPVGCGCDARFEDLLPLARKEGVGTVCFKSFGAGKLLGDTSGYNRPLAVRPRGKLSSGGTDDASPRLPHLAADQCIRYTLTRDPDVALLGMSFPNELQTVLSAVAAFRPISAASRASMRRKAVQALRGKGPCWWNPAR